MSDTVLLRTDGHGFQLPVHKSLDETLWREWQEKNGVHDVRNSIFRMRVVKCVCMAILLVTAAVGALSINTADGYLVAIRFGVALGALMVTAQALHTHQFVYAALFTAVALLYNPLVPTFTITGEWQRLVLLATVVAFAASLVSTRQSSLHPAALSQGRSAA